MNVDLRLDVPLPKGVELTASDLEGLRTTASKIVELLAQEQKVIRVARVADLVKVLSQDVPMREVDMRQARLQARALERIYNGVEWLTAEQVGELGGHGTANPAAAASRWKSAGQVFAIRRNARDMYPRYVFADDFTPLPAIREVLQVFGGCAPIRVAGWFESPSSFLGGRRPREVIQAQPDRVIAAARHANEAEQEPA